MSFSSSWSGPLSFVVVELLHNELVDYVKRQFKGDDDQAVAKLEVMGYDVGYRLAERFSRGKLRMMEPIQVIKFICKEFWTAVFRKQVDKLQTNYEGMYVLRDDSFVWLTKLSSATLDDVAMQREGRLHIAFSVGIVKGALTNLDMHVTVTAELRQIPACLFTIVDTGSAPSGTSAASSTS